MMTFNITKGLDLALAGAPVQTITPEFKDVQHVAVVGSDYVGMKPTLYVEVGEHVLAGQLLFEDKKNPGVKFVAPAAGVVVAVNRGEKRAFQSIVIELDKDDPKKSVEFEKFEAHKLAELCPNKTREILVRSGMWTALRTRPFSRSPKIDATPAALFVNVADTNPHAPEPANIVNAKPNEFLAGLTILSKIAGNTLWLCLGKNSIDSTLLEEAEKISNLKSAQFLGKHPSGLTGTHISKLEPCSLAKTVWSIGYQDVIAIGELFLTGQYPAERVIALSGPMVQNPRLIRVLQGAFVSEICQNELKDGPVRMISGSVLCGRAATEGFQGLGRFANQVSVIGDDDPRELWGWIMPNADKFSVAGSVASRYIPGAVFKMTTALHGGPRAIFPNPAFDKIMPLDIEPTFLFKALEIGDVDRCEKLGAFELDEEDLALCTLVDFGKNDYGLSLRKLLNAVMKEEE
ncbi:MAG: Na(+)-translocating NADH-quinone reductase subunit A [Planctomycetia bacterium]|nr:Na(+)-translocating NADH-quinone reductase subunit A [Planctomycetia bacterium]